jgi:hypothetical protein
VYAEQPFIVRKPGHGMLMAYAMHGPSAHSLGLRMALSVQRAKFGPYANRHAAILNFAEQH